MNTKTVGIYIRQALKIFHTLHLVFHLFLTQLAERNLLKGFATMLAASMTLTLHLTPLAISPSSM